MTSDDTAEKASLMSTEDQELFDSAVSNEPVQDTPVEPVAAQPEPAAQARDDQGRFATSEPNDGAGQPAAQPSGEADHREPPPHRFREVSERARAAEARNAELERLLSQLSQPRQPEAPKPEQPAVDMWTDPDAWADQRVRSTVDPVMQQMHSVLMHNAELIASSVLGTDKVAAAKQWFSEAQSTGQITPEEARRINASPNPFEAAVKAQQRHQAISTVGDDLEAYNQKIIADYLAKQGGQPNAAPAQAGSGTIVKLPPSLNRSTSAASSNGAGAEDTSDSALFQQTTSRRR